MCFDILIRWHFSPSIPGVFYAISVSNTLAYSPYSNSWTNLNAPLPIRCSIPESTAVKGDIYVMDRYFGLGESVVEKMFCSTINQRLNKPFPSYHPQAHQSQAKRSVETEICFLRSCIRLADHVISNTLYSNFLRNEPRNRSLWSVFESLVFRFRLPISWYHSWHSWIPCGGCNFQCLLSLASVFAQ